MSDLDTSRRLRGLEDTLERLRKADSENRLEANLTEFGAVLPYSGGAPATVLLAPSRNDYRYYIIDARAYLFVETTNNASNYWSFQLLDDNTNVIWSFNTSTDGAGSGIVKGSGTLNTVYAVTDFLNLNITGKTGAPGALSRCHLSVWYRLVP